MSNYISNLDPFIDQGTAAGTVNLAIHRGLTGYDAKGNLRPALAESWDVENAQSYTFRIRTNARFHNGDPVTAKDVQASLDWARNPKSSSAYLDRMQAIDRIEAIDSHTVRVGLKQPNVAFLLYLADPHIPIVPADLLSNLSKNPVGAGPFTLQSVRKDAEIRVKAFDQYYEKGLPNLSNIRFLIYKDSNLRTTALLSGDVDIIDYVPWENFSSIQQNGDMVLDTTEGPFMYLVFNAKREPFRKPEVRQAIAYAIQRQKVINGAFFGEGEPLNGMPIPDSSPFFDKGLANHWTYDLKEARKLLAQGGYPNGFTATMLSTSQYKMHKDTAAVIQSGLQEIGVDLQLDLPDWATRVQQGNSGEYDIAVMGSALDYNDPSALRTFLVGPPSYVRSFGFEDARIEKLLAAGLTTEDKGRRQGIYNELQTAALEETPIVTLNWRSEAYAYRRAVKGFANLPGALTYLSGYTFPETVI